MYTVWHSARGFATKVCISVILYEMRWLAQTVSDGIRPNTWLTVASSSLFLKGFVM